MKHLFLLLALSLPSVSPLYSKITMRVLLNSKKSITITPQTIRPDKTYGFRIDNQTYKVQDKLSISHHSQGFVINQKLLKGKSLEIIGVRAVKVDKTAYRGSLTIHREKKTLSLVNNVELEDYLRSVVPAEVYTSWNMEALKAQAVAARTYALYEKQRRKSGVFDVYDDTKSQVYKGMKSENKRTTLAVLQTEGQVLTYNNGLIKSYFSASIGGMSADGSEIGDSKPYLKPVKSYQASDNPNKLWTLKIPLKQIQQQYKTSQIKAVKTSQTTSGRVNQIQLKDSKGKVTKINGEKFRSKLGYEKMKSTRARFSLSGNYLVVQGTGFGHGVGMGQWEAQEFARRGANYIQILKYFYQDTKIKKLAS